MLMSRVRLTTALTALLVLTWIGPATAQVPVTGVDRIEEDWVLVLGTPSPEEAGPQITMTMSPVGDNTQMSMSFNLNYREDPFLAGGLQLRAWSGSSAIGQDSQETAQCSTPSETIRWTQRMSLSGGRLQYEVVGGQSTTWAKFGQGEHLTVPTDLSLASLDGYKASESVARSGVGWQSNRVTSLTLNQVRYYKNGALVAIIKEPQAVLSN